MKKRIIAILMALTMVLAYMPAMAFADDGEPTGPMYWYIDTEQDYYEVETGETVDLSVYAYVDTESYEDSGYTVPTISYAWYSYYYDDNDDVVLESLGTTGTSLEGADEGYYRCIATDNYGNEDYVNIEVYVYRPDYFGGDEINAGTISAGQTKTVDIEEAYEYYSFTFRPTVSGTYCFKADGMSDSVGRILDADHEEIHFADDSEGGLNFYINFDAETGETYYLQACCYGNETGTFTVELLDGEYNPNVELNNMLFWIKNDNEAGVSDTGYVDESGNWISNISGSVAIPERVAFGDGRTRTVTTIGDFSWNKNLTSVSIPSTVKYIQGEAFLNTGLTSITIPATVTEIDSYAVGFNYNNDNYTPVPGFVIFGTNGSAAQAYANKYGIAFRDPAAEAAAAAAAAEAARQGTPDGSIAKVKASKPKAAKGAVTVKWKKLNKKQLKKGKSTHYEVWVCPNKAFGAADTKMKVVGKGKSSAKIGGLAKKTTYYAKVRAIKYVGGVKMVGNWSAVKKIKTK